MPVVAHLPHLLDERDGEPHRRELLRRAAALLEAERAHRRLGGRALDGAALLRRPLPGRPERRGPVGGAAEPLAAARRAPASSSSAAPRSGRACPVLLRAFEALRGVGVPARLTVAGPTPEEVEPLLLDPEGIEIAGQVDDADKWRAARRGRPALRALAGRRELRHGAHRGVRLRHAGGGVRHRRATATSCATAATACSCPSATRSRSARRCSSSRRTRRGAPTMADAARRARRALRLAERGRARWSRSTRRRSSVARAGGPRGAGRAPHRRGPDRARSARRPEAASLARAEGRPPPGAAAWRAPRAGCWSPPARWPARASRRSRSSASASSRSAARSWPPPPCGCSWPSR